MIATGQRELKALQQEETQLESMFSEVKASLQDMAHQEDYKLYGYLTYEDIRGLNSSQSP
jgi:hypothetical protein